MEKRPLNYELHELDLTLVQEHPFPPDEKGDEEIEKWDALSDEERSARLRSVFKIMEPLWSLP